VRVTYAFAPKYRQSEVEAPCAEKVTSKDTTSGSGSLLQ
jgi:hypothetical protein